MRTRHLIACGLAALSLAAAGCGEEPADEARSGSGGAEETSEEPAPEQASGPAAETSGPAGEKPTITIPDGAEPPAELQIEDISAGDGAVAKAGDQLTVNYVGVSFSSGEEFDTSFGREPFPFQLGGGMVIPGWDQGLEGMKVGGRRQLTIPPDLAYGPQGQPPVIAPNETLVFAIDLVSIN